jgi:hypothetical protein
MPKCTIDADKEPQITIITAVKEHSDDSGSPSDNAPPITTTNPSTSAKRLVIPDISFD